MALKRSVLLMAFCFISTPLFSNKLYFPQVAFGGGYTTTIVLMNIGMTSVTSDFQIYAQTGSLLRSIPTTLPPGGSTRLTIADPGPSIISSWGTIDAGAATVQGSATFDVFSTTGALKNRAAVLGLEAAHDFIFPVDIKDNGTSNTGFALANVTNEDVTVILQLISEGGSGSPAVTGADARTITLGKGRQIAMFVTSIWPQLAPGFKGALLVVMNRQSNSLALSALNIQDGLLSAVPALSGVVFSCPGCWDY
jgi:hypothetical protein